MMRSRFLSRLPIDRNDAEAQYEASGYVERDALDWLAGTGTDIPAEVVESSSTTTGVRRSTRPRSTTSGRACDPRAP